MIRRPNWRRFSLRTLLVVTALASVGCYWLMLPTLNARRFAAAMKAQDYEAAESFFDAGQEKFPGDLKNEFAFPPNVVIEPLTWHDLWHGERQLSVGVAYKVGDSGIADCAYVLRSKRDRLEIVIALP